MREREQKQVSTSDWLPLALFPSSGECLRLLETKKTRLWAEWALMTNPRSPSSFLILSLHLPCFSNPQAYLYYHCSTHIWVFTYVQPVISLVRSHCLMASCGVAAPRKLAQTSNMFFVSLVHHSLDTNTTSIRGFKGCNLTLTRHLPRLVLHNLMFFLKTDLTQMGPNESCTQPEMQ